MEPCAGRDAAELFAVGREAPEALGVGREAAELFGVGRFAALAREAGSAWRVEAPVPCARFAAEPCAFARALAEAVLLPDQPRDSIDRPAAAVDPLESKRFWSGCHFWPWFTFTRLPP